MKVSIVITQDGQVSAWADAIDARVYASVAGARLIEDVEVQPSGTSI